MASTYHGDSTATQAPDLVPLPGDEVQLSLPASTDGGAVANWYQAVKTLADKVTYLNTAGRVRKWQPNYGPGQPTGSQNTSAIPTTGDPTIKAVVSMASASETYLFYDPDGGLGLSPQYWNSLVNLHAGTNGEWTQIAGVRGLWQKGATKAQWCFEQDVVLTDKTKGNYAFGLTNGSNPIIDTHGIYLWYDHGSGDHWQLQAGNTFANMAGASAGIASGALMRWKMIISGAATPRGVAAGSTGQILVYLNDALLYTYTGALTDLGNTVTLWPFQQSRGDGSGAGDAYFAPWSCAWGAKY